MAVPQPRPKAGRLTPELAGEIASASDENFRHRSVTVWDGDQSFVLAEPGRGAVQSPIKPSAAFKGDFAGFVFDDEPPALARDQAPD